jgi:hypothetical protein
MASDRNRLQSLVDALPDSEVQVAISFLAELGEQEIIDAETAAKLDVARPEPGDDVPLEEVRRRLGLSAPAKPGTPFLRSQPIPRIESTT